MSVEDKVGDVVRVAVAAHREGAMSDPTMRARWIDAVAKAIDDSEVALVRIAGQETALPPARLTNELKRTTFQLRSFATALRDGAVLGAVIDHANPEHPVAPTPDLRRMLVPIGPVIVFAASNFPFAFSVAGGDTASAWAAGCPVIVKAHPGHPRLSDAIAQLISSTFEAEGAPEGMFSLVHAQDEGLAILRHPDVAAASFTGSLEVGRELFDVASTRSRPIPFYGELGSVNPVFVELGAARSRPQEIADGFVLSFTGSVGQLCTKPGVLIVAEGTELPDMIVAAASRVPGGAMLNSLIERKFLDAEFELARQQPNSLLPTRVEGEARITPSLHIVSAKYALANPAVVTTERFGPSAVLIEWSDPAERIELAGLFPGTLTATIHADAGDIYGLSRLLPILEQAAGRLIWNGWPTGVAVSAAMHHGGPYPATTSSTHTSVGIHSIERFQRPITYQSFPDDLLPGVLKSANPWMIRREEVE